MDVIVTQNDRYPGLWPSILICLTLIPALKTNHIHYKLWDEITYAFLTSTVQPFKVRNG